MIDKLTKGIFKFIDSWYNKGYLLYVLIGLIVMYIYLIFLR